MKSLQEYMIEFRNQLEKGAIQKGYQGLVQYMLSLKNHFGNKYPNYSVSGSIYYGYMDMTYFSVFPKSLKDRDLRLRSFLFMIHLDLKSGCLEEISRFLQNTGRYSKKVAGIDIGLRHRVNGPIPFSCFAHLGVRLLGVEIN